MALCYRCRSHIPDFASQCPECTTPVGLYGTDPAQPDTADEQLALRAVALLLILVGLVYWFW